ncbi:MAG: glutamine synthetase [Alphaproteobacteria bacterium]|nr:glutamine synthetase [Alphaproteobacteria bacterium]
MDEDQQPGEAREFLAANPGIEVVETLLPDINGILRGKQLPIDFLTKLYAEGTAMTFAATTLNTRGAASESIVEGLRDGDPDGLCHPVPGTLVTVPWAARPTAQIMVAMHDPDGVPSPLDPRHVLTRAVGPLIALGLTPMVALEFEFYLLDARTLPPQPATPDGPFPAMSGPQVYSYESLYDFEDYVGEVEGACRAQGIPATTALAEYGNGQFEINLKHVSDVVLACDQAMMLKRAIKGVARKRGLIASFMAKPFAEDVGSGLHVHVSLLDRDGRNVFAGDPLSQVLRHAVGGLGAAMAESMAIFAPNANSYRRFRPGSYVPLSPTWGIDHRGVALRIPTSTPDNIRVEHRVAGADANPYLVLAAILAGLHHGIENEIEPRPMVERGAEIAPAVELSARWSEALNDYDRGTILARYFGDRFCDIFGKVRREEEQAYSAEIPDNDYNWYLRVI